MSSIPLFFWEGILPGTALFHALSALNFELREDHRLPLAEPSGKRQQELSQHLDEADHKAFFDSLRLDDRATVLSEMLTGASDFLEAVPCGDKVMANEEFACELRTRLCVRQYVDDSWCPLCDSVLDAKGRHAHVCPSGGDRTRRHNAIRNKAGAFADSAGFNPELEKPGLLQPSSEQPGAQQRRPADVFIPAWKQGMPAALDFAVTSPHRQDIRLEASRCSGVAAVAYEQHKRDHLNTDRDCQQQGFAFLPIVAETSAGWGPSAVCVFKTFARAISSRTGEDAAVVLQDHRQSIGIALRRANARATFARQPVTASFDDPALAAAAALS